MIILLYNTISIIVILSTVDTYDTIGISWMRVSIIVLLGIRSITWLRIFKPTRYLITMVLQVFIDIVPFIIILSSVIFIFAFVWRVSPTLGYIDPSTIDDLNLSFYQSIYDSTNIIFGNSPQSDPTGDRFTLIRFIVMIVGNVSLALALLNFLIAIISGTYEKINEDKDLHDAKELMDIVVEFDILLSWRIREGEKRKDEYILSLIPVKPVSDEIEKLSDIESNMNDKINGMEKRIYEQIDGLKKGIDIVKNESDEKMAKVLEYLKDISENGVVKGRVKPLGISQKNGLMDGDN